MQELEQLRTEIDEIDTQLLDLLAKRQLVVTKVGEFKQKHSIQVFDAAREEYLYKFHRRLSAKYNLSFDFIKDLFDARNDAIKCFHFTAFFHAIIEITLHPILVSFECVFLCSCLVARHNTVCAATVGRHDETILTDLRADRAEHLHHLRIANNFFEC